MNLKSIAIFALLALSASAPAAEKETKPKSHSEAHAAAHKAQLANAAGRMDKTAVSNLLLKEVTLKEESSEPVVASLSQESSQMLDDLLKEARTHLGKRYVHGAKGPSAFDCSGFSSYVYRQFGYDISPSSRDQFKQGEVVERNQLRKGDLVFFTSRRSGKNVGHVGIVTQADNEKGTFQFIHASVRGIKVDEYAGYYKNTYIGAKRIIID